MTRGYASPAVIVSTNLHRRACYVFDVLLADAPLTLREFLMHEELPLASVFREVFDFLQQRDDAVVFGAHAVNAYCTTERMTHDVDIMSTRATELGEELRARIAGRFHVAVRIREVADGVGFRIYQVRKPKNRHLIDVRQVATFPAQRTVDGVRFVDPLELTAMKAWSGSQRRGAAKGDTDAADLKRLLLAFPELQREEGPVADRLRAMGASEAALASWREIARTPIIPDEDETDDDEADDE